MQNSTALTGNLMEAKLANLKKIKEDGANWVFYYIDEKTNEKWVKEYPHSEYHGGGAPQLRLLDKFPWE